MDPCMSVAAAFAWSWTTEVFFGSMGKSMASLLVMGAVLDDVTACSDSIRKSKSPAFIGEPLQGCKCADCVACARLEAFSCSTLCLRHSRS
eukprot:3795145-Amphidinium_carterae.2